MSKALTRADDATRFRIDVLYEPANSGGRVVREPPMTASERFVEAINGCSNFISVDATSATTPATTTADLDNRPTRVAVGLAIGRPQHSAPLVAALAAGGMSTASTCSTSCAGPHRRDDDSDLADLLPRAARFHGRRCAENRR
jgi:hypothetical protein